MVVHLYSASSARLFRKVYENNIVSENFENGRTAGGILFLNFAAVTTVKFSVLA